MRISCYTGGMVETNAYLVETQNGNFLVDAPLGVVDWLKELGVRLDALYLTHHHYDHVEGVADLQEAGVKVCAWAEYSKDLTLEAFAGGWGLPEVRPFRVDELLEVGERNLFGGKPTRIGHVPGHSVDSLVLYVEEWGVVFAGDALFKGSVGRCDLPGGSFELLLEGIRRDLLTLPDETKVFPGHGPVTTIGSERKGNSYLA